MRRLLPVLLLLSACGGRGGDVPPTFSADADNEYAEYVCGLPEAWANRGSLLFLRQDGTLSREGRLLASRFEVLVEGAVEGRADTLYAAMRAALAGVAAARVLRSAPLGASGTALREYYAALYRADSSLLSAFMAYASALGNSDSAVSEALMLAFRDFPTALASVEPRHCDFYALLLAHARYTGFQRAGGWATDFALEPGKKLIPGDTGETVAKLQERLAAEGLYSGAVTGRYDSLTAEAVKVFQLAHLLTADGETGRFTAEELNVPVSKRVKALRATLAYWKDYPERDFAGFFVRVNLPGFKAEVRDSFALVRTFRVAIGGRGPKNKSQTFTDEIEMIVVNPKWNVPDRILEEELLEDMYEMGDVREFLKKKKYKAVNTEGGVKLVQNSGWGNALGRIKFLFPNRHNIYLHDTPSKSVFSKERPTVSHGCIRLQDADSLAVLLFEREGLDGRKTLNRFLAARYTTSTGGKAPKEIWYYLKEKVPIRLEYVLVDTDTSGQVIFLPDVYWRLN